MQDLNECIIADGGACKGSLAECRITYDTTSRD